MLESGIKIKRGQCCFVGTVPPIKGETWATLCRVCLGFYILPCVFIYTYVRRTNRGHTGGGKHLGLLFFLAFFRAHLSPAVLTLNFCCEKGAAILSSSRQHDAEVEIWYSRPLQLLCCRS